MKATAVAPKVRVPTRTTLVPWFGRPLLLIWLAFAGYYYWTVQPHIFQAVDEHGVYNDLADAFLQRQASLLILPDPELAKLPDPYDPIQNGPYRFHDMSYYKNRYYAYFGPAAAVTLFAPFKLIFRRTLPDRVGAWLFATGALIAGCILLNLLLGRMYPSTPRWLYFTFCITLGFCNTFPFLLRRPAVYEVAIASAQFFLISGLALLYYAAYDRKTVWTSFLAGFVLATAVGARPSLVLALPVLALLVALDRTDAMRHRMRKVAAATVPAAISIVLWGLYNWICFDSPFEFGTKYQLYGFHPLRVPMFNAARLPGDIFAFLLLPPRFSDEFPFILGGLPSWTAGGTYMVVETVTGLLWASPLLLGLFGTWLVLRREPPVRRHQLAWILAAFAGIGFVLLFLDAALLATMRYEADFATVLFLAAALVWAGLLQKTTKPRWKPAAYTAIVLLASFGILLNAAIGLKGYYGGLDESAPEQYQFLENLFS